MNAHTLFLVGPPNHLANEYAARCGRMSSELVYVETCLRVALEACKTEERLRASVQETLASIQRAIAETRNV